MATRSRTLLFVQYRNSFSKTREKRKGGLGVDMSEQAGLIANETVAIEMGSIPPQWVTVVHSIQTEFANIKEKLKSLETAHKKNLLPGFDDTGLNEASIDRLAESISKMFRDTESSIKSIKNDSKVTKNVQQALASQCLGLSSQFRKIQSSYLSKLRGREAKKRDVFAEIKDAVDEEDVFTDAQLQSLHQNETAITEREKEIQEIVKSIMGVAQVFKELQAMVIDQGTILDRVDYNIEQVDANMETAHKELIKGSKYQNSARMKLYCIAALFVVISVLIVIVIIKSHAKK